MQRHGRNGRSALRFGLTGLRVLVGLLFVTSGLTKFTDHAQTVADFAHWSVPLAELAAYVVGGLDVVGGALLVLGVATRLVALPLLAVMVGAVVTVGLTDGGQHLVLPPVLALLCGLFATRGGGAWQLLPMRAVAVDPSLG